MATIKDLLGQKAVKIQQANSPFAYRKLVKDMDKDEVKYLKKKLAGTNFKSFTFNPTFHSMKRSKERAISKEQILSVIENGDVIEYSTRGGDKAVLIRERIKEQTGVEFCVRLCLKTKRIITVFDTEKGDEHDTLNKATYTDHKRIFDYL